MCVCVKFDCPWTDFMRLNRTGVVERNGSFSNDESLCRGVRQKTIEFHHVISDILLRSFTTKRFPCIGKEHPNDKTVTCPDTRFEAATHKI